MKSTLAAIHPALFSAILALALVLLTVVCTTPLQAQTLYKWVDAQGKTHYGDQLPEGQKSSASSLTKPSAIEQKKLSPETQAAATDAAAGLMKMNGDGSELACPKAVGNARSGVEGMLEVAEKNFKGGYMAKAEYEAGTKGLRGILAKLSVSECQSSSGSVRGFYQCMSSDNNHVAACGQKFKY
jgi:hypothetical protein